MNQDNKQTGSRYQLFEHMVDEYGLHLLDSQIDDITLIAAEINGIKSLREELEKLRAWKESAMKTLGVVDLQECGKLLNIGLGQSIADKIVPGIKELRAENERLKNETEEWKLYGKSWSEKSASRLGEVISLDEQNQKLREALVRISNEEIASDEGYWDTLDRIRMIAKEALKGKSDES